VVVQGQDVSPEHVDALCPELRAVVDDAVAAGNEVAETWTSFGKGVALREPLPILVDVPATVRTRLQYRDVSDPHYWLGEIFCTEHKGWYLVVPFGSHFTMQTAANYQLGLAPLPEPTQASRPRPRWWRRRR
jgi:hypothetical protein